MDIIAKNITTITSDDGSPAYIVRKPKLSKKPFYFFFKRIFDIIASFVAIILLAIPMLIISVIIVIDSPGGAIYKQDRLGLGGKNFTLYKFRTMINDAEKESGACWATENDIRCTKLGRFLRQTRLDELPQLFNIIKGDMSIVGPRPERAVFYDEFEKYIDGFRLRLLAIPGLTGHAQVNGGYELSPEEKVAYDLEYMESCSFKMDIKIIFKTIYVVFTRKDAR